MENNIELIKILIQDLRYQLMFYTYYIPIFDFDYFLKTLRSIKNIKDNNKLWDTIHILQ